MKQVRKHGTGSQNPPGQPGGGISNSTMSFNIRRWMTLRWFPRAQSRVEHPNGDGRYQRESGSGRLIGSLFPRQLPQAGGRRRFKNNDRWYSQHVPFGRSYANAILRPSISHGASFWRCGNLFGYDKNYPAVRRALAFLRRERSPMGPCFGRRV